MKPKNISWSIYARNGFGRRLAQFGQWIGSDRLIYNPMVMRHFHDDALLDSPRVISAVLEAFPEAQKFLDVGSGSGAFAAELLRRSKDAVALERSPHGRALAIKQGVDCRPFDLMDVPAAKQMAHSTLSIVLKLPSTCLQHLAIDWLNSSPVTEPQSCFLQLIQARAEPVTSTNSRIPTGYNGLSDADFV